MSRRIMRRLGIEITAGAVMVIPHLFVPRAQHTGIYYSTCRHDIDRAILLGVRISDCRRPRNQSILALGLIGLSARF
jgi:hypothetical protein